MDEVLADDPADRNNDPVLQISGQPQPDGSIHVASGRALRLVWKSRLLLSLNPILPRPSSGMQTALQRDLSRIGTRFGTASLASGISQKGKTTLRNKLAVLYRKHFSGSTNRSSLMMLAAMSSGPSWLYTGDADLTDPNVFGLLAPFAADLASLDAVQVPHHGSPHNISQAAVNSLTATSTMRIQWIIATGRNKWKYPAPSVTGLNFGPGRFVQVYTSSYPTGIHRF